MSYVYRESEPGLWTVGYYAPNGEWWPEQDCDSPGEAAARVSWLNGGAAVAAPGPEGPGDPAEIRTYPSGHWPPRLPEATS